MCFQEVISGSSIKRSGTADKCVCPQVCHDAHTRTHRGVSSVGSVVTVPDQSVSCKQCATK